MIKMNALSAKQQQLQKQYAKTRQIKRRNSEAIRKGKGQSHGGCLWSLLPLPILIGLYGVIRKPLTYMMNLTADEVKELSNFLFDSVVSSAGNGEIKIAEELYRRLGEVMSGLPNLAGKLFRWILPFWGSTWPIPLSGIPRSLAASPGTTSGCF
jgi:YidC/Oxa1 family membrane protein insertase